MKLALAVIAIGIAALAFGCSDSSETLTLEEYFAEFEAIDADIDAQIELLYVDFPTGTDEEIFSDDSTVSFFKDLLAGFEVALSDSLERAQELAAPSEVEDEHDALLEAVEKNITAFEAGSEAIKDVETMAEFETVFPPVESDIDAAQLAFETACLDVVAVGEANGITVDVDCLDDE